ncbi:MAG: 30S ribosomal protein S15 [Candidatus Aenigmatarchaeota archaeon]
MPKKADWVTYEKDELEALVAKLAKEGNSSAMIGQLLRDQYGIPDVRKYGIRISKVAHAAVPRKIPEDMLNLLKQAVKVHRHLAAKPKDSKARHALDRIESKIRRLARFYVKEKKLPKDWTYSIERAKIIVG